MEVILSAAVSLDGFLDDNTPQRLRLSSPEDWRRVELLRAECDAILVGAGTVRRDNPSLVIKDERLRAERIAGGLCADIDKVTLTSSGDLDPRAGFFLKGGGRKIVFAPLSADDHKLAAFSEYADIVRLEEITARSIVESLAAMGYKRLMVEGGSRVLTMFLEEGAADRLRLAVAPFLVGDQTAPRLVCGGRFPYNKDNRLTLENVEMLGDMAVMHYKTNR